MIELSVSGRLREYVEKLNKQSLERWGKEVYPEEVPLDLLTGSICRVVKTGLDYVVLDCGEYEVTLSAVIGFGDIEMEAYVDKKRFTSGSEEGGKHG